VPICDLPVEASRGIPVSIIILTKNEELAIRRTLEALTRFNEVFVVDSASTDRTRDIAQSAGAVVVDFSWNGAYPKKKGWALENLPFKNDWVLYIDADEIVPPALADEIADLIESGPIEHYSAFDIALEYAFLGRYLKFGHSVRKRALIRRSDSFWPIVDDLHVSNMWEVEGHYQPITTGQIGSLVTRLVHEDPDPIFDYFSRHNRYSDWEAQVDTLTLQNEPLPRSRNKMARLFARLPMKSVFMFLYAYVFKLGFLDGRAGLHYAIAQSFYYWQIAVKTRELRLQPRRARDAESSATAI
jgi:glycosyltransferase involved in cell wall biosynthesis